MSKRKEFDDNLDKDVQLSSTGSNGLDEKRRNFLKKLLISAAYVTPVILTLSMKNLEAKAPTRIKKIKY